MSLVLHPADIFHIINLINKISPGMNMPIVYYAALLILRLELCEVMVVCCSRSAHQSLLALSRGRPYTLGLAAGTADLCNKSHYFIIHSCSEGSCSQIDHCHCREMMMATKTLVYALPMTSYTYNFALYRTLCPKCTNCWTGKILSERGITSMILTLKQRAYMGQAWSQRVHMKTEFGCSMFFPSSVMLCRVAKEMPETMMTMKM